MAFAFAFSRYSTSNLLPNIPSFSSSLYSTITLPSHVFLISYFLMAIAIQTASLLHQYVWSWLHPTPSKRPDAVKMGVMVESSDLDPATIIYPATSHPNIILHAIAAPDVPTAERLRSKYHFAKAYGSHRALLADEDIDAVYVSAPIGLRLRAVESALEHGKHVLCESPFAANAQEVERLVIMAKESSLVLLEGVHWQFHPAMHAWRRLVDSKEFGRILRTETVMASTPGIPQNDERWKFDLAGGSAMALPAALSTTRYSLHATAPTKLDSVTARLSKTDPRIDAALHANLIFQDPQNHPVHSKIYTDMARPWAAGLIPRVWELPSIEVETEKAVLFFYNFLQPHLYHFFSVTDKRSGETVYKKQYVGGPFWGNLTVSTGKKGGHPGWSTYRWQLEAFAAVVTGNTPAYWVAAQESIWNMESVDAVYRAGGLPVRESVRADVEK